MKQISTSVYPAFQCCSVSVRFRPINRYGYIIAKGTQIVSTLCILLNDVVVHSVDQRLNIFQMW